MNIIFCLAHHAVRATITVVDGSPADDFLVVTSKEDVAQMFRVIYPPQKVLCLPAAPLASRNPVTLVKNLVNVHRLKRQAWMHFDGCQGANIYFLEWAFCDFEFWLLKRLARANRILYGPVITLDSRLDLSPKALLGAALRWMAYFAVLEPRKGPYFRCYSVGSRFLRSVGAARVSVPDRSTAEVSRRIMESLPPGLRSAKVMLLPASQVGPNISETEYIAKMDAVIEALDRCYGLDHIAVKAHPRFPHYRSLEAVIQKIPSYLDANLLFPFFDVYIGYASSVLFQAANAGKTAVSLLELIEPLSSDDRRSYRDYLDMRASNPIHYPVSIDDLVAILGECGPPTASEPARSPSVK
jgi:hypothetical protein